MEPGAPAQPHPSRPKDWRFWVGGAGRILMTVGLLMFGFVGYQLWGTGIEYRQHQKSLGNEFEERMAALSTPTTVGDGATPTTGPSSTVPEASPSTSTPTPDSMTPATWPQIELGDVIAEIEIPKIHRKVYAVAGVRVEDLKQGIGHYPDTVLPGQIGNAAFAGHRTTYGGPLFRIDELRAGDQIIVTTITNQRYVYRMVGEALIVAPEAYEVIQSKGVTTAMLTLTSCHPRYSARKRIVVHAELDASLSGPVAPATRYYAPVPATSVDAGPTDSVVDDPTLAQPDLVDVPEGTEALSKGWFSDSAAWPQVTIWGLVVAVIGAGAWLLSRRTRRWWLGPLAGLAPFVVTLYFFYQNVNRLLPPNL